VDAEALVVPGLGAGFGDELVEAVLALGGQLEDTATATGLRAPGAAGRRAGARGRCGVGALVGGLARRRVGGLGNQPGALEPAQGRVERAPGERPERAETGVQLLAQLVAVHRGLVEQAEHREFEHGHLPRLSPFRAISLRLSP
jgi:hypothetical protein